MNVAREMEMKIYAVDWNFYSACIYAVLLLTFSFIQYQSQFAVEALKIKLKKTIKKGFKNHF